MSEYFFPNNFDLSVNQFFSEYPLKDWNLSNFISYNNTDQNYNSALQQFDNNLRKIQKCNIPQQVKSVIGRVLRAEKAKSNCNDRTNTIINIKHSQINQLSIISGSNCTSSTSSVQKKRKVNHIEHSPCWDVESEEDVWEAWRQYLTCNSDRHEFCLGKNHIIECGSSIHCSPNIPEELYNHIDSKESISSPFAVCPGYVKKIMTAFKSALAQKELMKIISEDAPSNHFIEPFFSLCATIMNKHNLKKRLEQSESQFNYLLVWPVLELAVELADHELYFLPGEYTLESSKQEYKADGCIRSDNGDEISLLETSGCFMLGDRCKYGYDYIKCTFGALMIYNNIIKKYYWATEVTALSLKLPFVHAMHDNLCLWTLELCSSKLYISNKVYKCTVPTSKADAKNILALGSFACLLKNLLDKVLDTIEKMKEEHEDFET